MNNGQGAKKGGDSEVKTRPTYKLASGDELPKRKSPPPFFALLLANVFFFYKYPINFWLFEKREYTYFAFFVDILVYTLIMFMAFAFALKAVCPCLHSQPTKQSSEQNGSRPGDNNLCVFVRQQGIPDKLHFEALPACQPEIAESSQLARVFDIFNSNIVSQPKVQVVLVKSPENVVSLFRNSVERNLRRFVLLFVGHDLLVPQFDGKLEKDVWYVSKSVSSCLNNHL